MIAIVCVDDRFGMMFNGRRQSQDRILRERVLNDVKNGSRRLWMTPYSQRQFFPTASDYDSFDYNASSAKLLTLDLQIFVDDDFLNLAKPGDFCFVENRPLAPYLAQLEKIILYRWNRIYPADFYFDLAKELEHWKLVSATSFVGTSHDEITREVYEI